MFSEELDPCSPVLFDGEVDEELEAEVWVPDGGARVFPEEPSAVLALWAAEPNKSWAAVSRAHIPKE